MKKKIILLMLAGALPLSALRMPVMAVEEIGTDVVESEEENAYIGDGIRVVGDYYHVEELDNIESISSYGDGDEHIQEDWNLPAAYKPDYNALPSLRSQSPYGTCWAHASVFGAEMAAIKAGRADENVDYSELQLSYFYYNPVVDPLGGTVGDTVITNNKNYLNYGGNTWRAATVMAQWVGIADETTVPYSLAEDVISYGLDAKYATGYDVAHLENAYMFNAEDRDAIKKRIYDGNGMAIAYCDDDMYYNETYNSYYCPTKNTTNHAVAVVGWDDNFPSSNFGSNVSEGDGAWLIRNSWTTRTQESHYGYFWLSYYDKSLGDFVSCDFAVGDNYDNNYQYDGGLVTRYYGFYDDTTFANVFTSKDDGNGEVLRAVSFEAHNSNVNYTIKIYCNLADPANPESGTLIDSATTNGATTYVGYYTIPLSDEVNLEPGESFSVVLTLEKQGDPVWMSYETPFSNNNYSTFVESERGQSFLYNGGIWKDVKDYAIKSSDGTIRYMDNFRIKAFTDDAKPDRKYISNVQTSLSIASKLDMNFYFDVPNEFLSDDEAVILLDGQEYPVNELSGNSDGDMMSCVLTVPICPRNIDKDISFECVNAEGERYPINNDGEEPSYEVSNSLRRYLGQLSNIPGEKSEQYKHFAEVLEYYCDCAKSYFNGTEVPAVPGDLEMCIASITSENMADKARKVIEVPPALEYVGSSLILKSDITVRHYFSVKPGFDINNYKVECGSKELNKVVDGGMFYVDVEGINIDRTGTSHNIYINNRQVLKYSAQSYIYDALSKNGTGSLLELAKALKVYSDEVINNPDIFL